MTTRAFITRFSLGSLCLALATARAAEAPDIYARIEKISAAVEEARKKYDVPGVSVTVFRNYAVEWSRGYGVTSVATRQPVDTLTLFQAASISKPVAALAAMRLIEEGRLELDRNINDSLTTWKLPENDLTRATPVTLRMLLSHTGGLTVHGFKGYEAGTPIPTVPQIFDAKPPANSEAIRVTVAPGTKYDYSGGGYTILQQLLSDVTHLPFPQLMRNLVLAPVGMRLSTYEQPLPANRAAFAASGHEPHGQVIKGDRHVYPEMAAAGLYTTPSDLARFAIALQRARLGLDHTILSRDLARLMTAPQPPGNYGLGFEMLRPREEPKRFFGHTGGNVGFRCMLLASLEGGNGVAVMTNGDEFRAVSDIISKVVAEYAW